MKYLMALIIALLVPTAAMAKSECKEDKQKFCKDVIEANGDVALCSTYPSLAKPAIRQRIRVPRSLQSLSSLSAASALAGANYHTDRHGELA
jgi:hypothetical protein